MYTYSTLQIQGIKRFACQMRLLQTQNACKRCAKRVYYKRRTRVNAALNAFTTNAKRVYSTLNAFAGNAFCETNRDSSRAKGVAHSRDVHVLEFCGRY